MVGDPHPIAVSKDIAVFLVDNQNVFNCHRMILDPPGHPTSP